MIASINYGYVYFFLQKRKAPFSSCLLRWRWTVRRVISYTAALSFLRIKNTPCREWYLLHQHSSFTW